ncbi:hypothetical protein BDZ89DRAFT_1157112 [Hymenopellis radicata]|nr:hypothetical protein BDZ89DRAFT_1157112 [Hymenopellis radicata]
MPYEGAAADLHDMQATIEALLHYMQYTSSMGNIPLSEFPHHPHAVRSPRGFDVPPLRLEIGPVDTDLVSLSVPSTTFMIPDFHGDLHPSPHSFSAALSASFEWIPSWNPSDDPVIDSGRRRTRNIAPGSAQAVYDLGGTVSSNPMGLVNLVHDFGQLTLHQPTPKRIVNVELIELKASVQEDSGVSWPYLFW